MHRALDAAIEQIDTEITGLRRLITDLRPAALDEFGIQSAVESLAERVSATTGLEVALEIDLDAGRARPPRSRTRSAGWSRRRSPTASSTRTRRS